MFLFIYLQIQSQTIRSLFAFVMDVGVNGRKPRLLFLVLLLASARFVVSLQVSVKENSPENTLIVDLPPNFNLAVPDHQIPNLSFTISSPHQKYFSISNKAELRCSGIPLDREELCHGSGPCMARLRITLVSPKQYFQIIDVTVEVLDENDNEPIFNPSTFNVSILENVQTGSLYNLPLATDRDVGSNDIQTFEIDEEDAIDLPFELQIKSYNRMKKQVMLRVKNELDREKVPFYRFKVKAIDGGQPEPKTGTLIVSVNVADVNDNHPIFEKSLYQITVDEDFRVDDVILTVKATDADEGANGEIRYEIVPGQWEVESMFRLDESTGELRLIDLLDHSKNSNYSIEIAATDLSQEGFTSYSRIEVVVNDINNNAPLLSINPLSQDGHAEIYENVKKGTFVFHLYAKDADSGDNGRVNCFVVSSFPEEDVFALNPTSGHNEFILTTAVENIDRETTPSYQLTIRCEDFGSPVLSSTTDVVIKVLDVDDNPPFFEKPLYMVEIEENNQVDQVLLQVRADDLDSDINASMRFHLSPGSRKEMEGLIKVDENTGVITALRSFDYEAQQEYRFTVVVDNTCQSCQHLEGSPTTSSADVLLKIIDKNDNAPEFSRRFYQFEIPENSPFSTEVGSLRATDKDSEPFNSFTFHVEEHTSSVIPFHVDPVTGKITTTKSLDREITAAYNFTVKAVDTNDPNLSSSVLVEIAIIDLNDNSPIFLADCQNSKTDLGVVETDVVEVCRFVAKDADEGANGEVKYSLVREVAHKIFNISVDGILYLNTYSLIDAPKDLFVNSTAILNVTVLAKDNGNPQLLNVLKTTAEINLLPVFSMQALRERRDGYFAGRLDRILALCGGIFGVLVILAILVALCCYRNKKAGSSRGSHVKVQVKRPLSIPKDPNASSEGMEDSADETDNLKSMNDNNSNNNKIPILLPNTKFHDNGESEQTLKYDFSDLPNSSLTKKKGKNGDSNQFFSLSRKRVGSRPSNCFLGQLRNSNCGVWLSLACSISKTILSSRRKVQ